MSVFMLHCRILLLQMVTAFGPKGLLSSDKRVVYAGAGVVLPAAVKSEVWQFSSCIAGWLAASIVLGSARLNQVAGTYFVVWCSCKHAVNRRGIGSMA
jgi:hypothetical protein